MRMDLRKVVSIAGVVAVLGVAACSSSSKSKAATGGTTSGGGGATTTAAGSPEGQAATQAVAPFLNPPTSINISTPLSKAPPKGLKVGWLEGNLDAIRVITPGFQE